MDNKENVSIIAFDILPMSSTERREGVRVAASAIFNDGRTKEWSQLSRKKLFKLVKKHKFRYLGTDNPAEIVENNETIASFCDNLPTSCSLVHVNLTKNGNTIPLRSLVVKYEIDGSGKKLSAVKTARAIAMLIQKGVGMILEPFENETLINVGKPGGSSKGGWSQARYQRQNEEVVGREANKIKELLDKNKLPYDEIIHSTKYGAKLARFHVFKSRKLVDDIFSNTSFYPANVKIWSPKKELITHRPLENTTRVPTKIFTHLRRLIVGIDPGMTTGIAIMNLNGKVLNVFSRKNLSKGQLVTEISDYGVPVLICADVNPIPTFVSKFAATYNAEIFAPGIELSKEDKRYLSNQKEFTRRFDSHERDALAATIYAYNKLKDKLEKIDSEDLRTKEKDIAKGLVIRGLSIKDSISSVKLLRNTETRIEGIQKDKDYHEKDLELIGRVSNLLEELAESETIISNLRAHSGRLESQNELLVKEIENIKRKISKRELELTRNVLQSEIIEEKDRLIQNLKNQNLEYQRNIENNNLRINDLEEMLWISIDKGGIPVKILPKFSHDAINQLRQTKNLDDGDVILILDPTGAGPQTAENLAKTKLDFVFTEEYELPTQAFEVLYEAGIPVRRADKYEILRSNYMGIINQHNFLKAKQDYQEYVKTRKDKEKTEKIFKTIENYQYQRQKELLENRKTYDDYELDEEANYET